MIKAGIFLPEIKSSEAVIISFNQPWRGGSCWVEELCCPSRAERRDSQLQYQERRGGGAGEEGMMMILQTADIEH